MFRLLDQAQYNFLKGLTRDEFKVFRQRAIGLILATDMAKHASDLSAITMKLSTMQIRDGENIDKLVGDGLDGKEIF